MRGQDRPLIVVVAAIAAIAVWAILSIKYACPPDFHPSGQGSQCYSANDLGWWQSAAAWTAIFTGFLTVSTVALWLATHRAAVIAQSALTDLERPFIYAEVSQFDYSETHRSGTDFSVTLGTAELSLLNCGRTAAILKRLEWRVRTARRGGIPDPIDPRVVGGRELPAGIVSYNGAPFSETENLLLRFSEETKKALALGHETVWIIGFVRYESIFGLNYICGFSLARDRLTNNFVLRGGNRYNYSRSENPETIPPPSNEA